MVRHSRDNLTQTYVTVDRAQIMSEDSYTEGAQDGSYINGLYLDGARWDRQR